MGSRRWRTAAPERRAAILGPVHLRRGEIRDEDLIALPEPVEAPEPALDEAAVETLPRPVVDQPAPLEAAVEALPPPVAEEPASDGPAREPAVPLETSAAEPATPSDEPAA
jgi:hypothetical protein